MVYFLGGTTDPQDIPNYSPEQKFRGLKAIYIPNEGWFNPRLIVEKLDAILLNSPQVKFLDKNLTRLHKLNNEIQYGEFKDGSIVEGDKFILAAGASSQKIMLESNLDLNMQGMYYGIGVSIEINSPRHRHTHCIRTPNRGLACGVYSVPYFYDQNNQDKILIGASNYISHEPHMGARLESVQSLLNAAASQINVNFGRADVTKINVGWRPTSQDTYPLIGATSINNLIIATGTKRDGFHMAPFISDHVVKILLNLEYDNRFDVFKPERELIFTMSREDAIEKSIQHLLSADYQHGYLPSRNNQQDQLISRYRDNLNMIYDKCNVGDRGIPAEMLQMYEYGRAFCKQT
jgi:glycine/D-amino acid oxidase-like deaminating enzyme